MADNVGITPGSGATAASDDIGGVQFQRIKLVHGADGVNDGDVSSTNGLPTYIVDPSAGTSFGPVTTANTILFSAVDTANERAAILQLTGNYVGGVQLQASNDGTEYWPIQGYNHDGDQSLTDTFTGPGLVQVPLTARWFRAVTTSNFSGSVSGNYTLRSGDYEQPFGNVTLMGNDPSYSSPIAAVDVNNYPVRVRATPAGQLIPADGQVFTGSLSRLGLIVQVDTTGYNSIVLQLVNTWAGTVSFEASNDGSTWVAVVGWPSAGAAAPVTSSTANGQWILPASGRFFRARVSAYTSGVMGAVVVLRNAMAFATSSSPNIAANSSVNVAQLGGTTPVNAGVAGTLAVGGNVAVGSAPTLNPIALCWDGTNTRRILTDASNGGVVLGSSAVTNGQTAARYNQTATTPAASQLKATAGRLTALHISQMSTVAGFLHIYNASSVSLGTTNDTLCYAVPATVGVTIIPLPDGGLFLSSGIGLAFTAGSANNDNTAFGSAPSLTANYSFI